MQRLYVIFLASILTVITACATRPASQVTAHDTQSWTLSSPNNQVEIQVRTTSIGALEYRVQFVTEPVATQVLGWSPLGLTLRTYDPRSVPLRERVFNLDRELILIDVQESEGEDSYTLKTGKRLENHAHYRALSVYFRDPQGLTLALDLRAYDEGVAFRYRLPDTTPQHYQVLAEHTGFNVGKGATHWGAPYDFITLFHPSYETFYQQVPSGTSVPKGTGTGWSFPSLFERDNLWFLMHETDLDEHYHGVHLHPDAPGGLYRVVPPLEGEALGYGSIIPSAPLPWTMPWRFLIVSDNPADIVESNLVYHLASPSRVADDSWIQPGLATWSWWSDHDSPQNPEALKDFIDFAAELGWPYSLMDANWNLNGPNILEELTDYARAKNVGLLFWYNSGGRHNSISEQPRNLLDERLRRRAEFARLQAAGVKGLKIDFFQSDKQDIIRHYIEIFEDAAEFELVLVLHGSTIPRGWERTWPHVMTLEAVRGAEFYTFSEDDDYGEHAPSQNTILPFVRNVIGPMDYTPGSFAPPLAVRRTTTAHEAALLVVFESGIQHLAESAAVVRQLPDTYRQYLAELPAAWDETRLLEGYPGLGVTLARRSGARWYIAGINGEASNRSVHLDLSALVPAAASATLLYDSDQQDFAARPLVLGNAPLSLTLVPNGGFVLIVDTETQP